MVMLPITMSISTVPGREGSLNGMVTRWALASPAGACGGACGNGGGSGGRGGSIGWADTGTASAASMST